MEVAILHSTVAQNMDLLGVSYFHTEVLLQNKTKNQTNWDQSEHEKIEINIDFVYTSKYFTTSEEQL